MVGDGNHGVQFKLFNLTALEIKCQPGSHRGGPIALCVIHAYAVLRLCSVLQPRKQWADYSVFAAQIRQKIQRLFGLVGMAVERDPVRNP